jgi:beta-xylosidase
MQAALFAQPASIAYQNPIVHTDYSDPDVIRVGRYYYMTASSFNFVPGLPILQSEDLVHWKLVSYALAKNIPDSAFRKVQHGGGVWAPSIRFIGQKFVIFYPDPDRGIYKVEAKAVTGPWSSPEMVLPGKGLIDPCPIQTNGKNYLVYALAGSRAGVKSILLLTRLNDAMNAGVGNPILVYDGHQQDPTVEGPKLFQRNGWYYIFAPAGGVRTGWQLVLRSRKIEGPYERKIVLQQGSTNINGPHQGAWVTDRNGRDWFFHFQDKASFGRVVHLQPMRWVNDWPEMGDFGNGKPGEPLSSYGKPAARNWPNGSRLLFEDQFVQEQGWHKAWQWSANPEAHWAFLYNNQLRLFAGLLPGDQKNLWNYPAWFTQKLPADSFVATAKLHVGALLQGEEAGLGILGTDYARIFVQKDTVGYVLQFAICQQADMGKSEINYYSKQITGDSLLLRVRITPQEQAYFSFSLDGRSFQDIPSVFVMKPGKWVGARLGLFCLRRKWLNDAGAAGFDWCTIQQ